MPANLEYSKSANSRAFLVSATSLLDTPQPTEEKPTAPTLVEKNTNLARIKECIFLAGFLQDIPHLARSCKILARFLQDET